MLLKLPVMQVASIRTCLDTDNLLHSKASCINTPAEAQKLPNYIITSASLLGPALVLTRAVSRSAYVLKSYFGTSTKCVDYAGVLSFKCPQLDSTV